MNLRIAISLSLCVALIVSLCGCSRTQVEAKERSSVASPNGALQAKIGVEEADNSLRLQFVYVIPTGRTVRLKNGDTVGMTAAIVHDCRDENFEVVWLSDVCLEVRFRQNSPSWVTFVPQVQGVRIVMRNLSAEAEPTPKDDGARAR